MPAPEHLSPSGWNTWDICPRQWAAKYLLGIQSPLNPEAEAGSFAHRVLEHLYNDYPEARTIGNARDIATNLWDERDQRWYGRIASIESGAISEREFKDMAWKGIAGDFKLEDPTEVQVVATEHHAKWTEAGVPFYTVIDRVDGPIGVFGPGMMVNDYKTGKVPKKDRMPTSHRQVVIEAMGAAATIPGDGIANQGCLLFTTKGKVVPVDTSLRSRSTVLKDAVGVWGQMRAYVDSGASWGDYEANVGSLCGWCPVADRCPEGREHVVTMLGDWLTPERGHGAHLVAVAEGMIEETF